MAVLKGVSATEVFGAAIYVKENREQKSSSTAKADITPLTLLRFQHWSLRRSQSQRLVLDDER